MPSVNVSEKDFMEVADAARQAQARGDKEAAEILDKLARKINAALSVDHPSARIARMASGKSSVFTWRDVPSVLIERG